MFDRKNAIEAFVVSAGTDPRELPIDQAFAAMFDFYANVPPDGAQPVEEDGDMLLFEHGTHNWGEGEAFEISLTRQVVWEPEVDEIEYWQLRLVFSYDPKVVGDAVGKGLQWCGSQAGVQHLRRTIEEAPAFCAVQEIAPDEVRLDWERQ